MHSEILKQNPEYFILTRGSYQKAGSDSVSLGWGLRWYSSKPSQMVLRLLVPGPYVTRF